MFRIESKAFSGEVKIISSKRFEDRRGFLSVTFSQKDFERLGLPTNFVRDMYTQSVKNTIRGLHFQLDPPMGKLIRVSQGRIFATVTDIRKDSSTFSQYFATELSSDLGQQLWIPSGFAFGYCVLTDCEVQYKCTEERYPMRDHVIAWDDSDIDINWPIHAPILSERDRVAPTAEVYFGVKQ